MELIPKSLKAAIRRAAFEKSRAAYDAEVARLTDGAARAIALGSDPERVENAVETIVLEAQRANDLRRLKSGRARRL